MSDRDEQLEEGLQISPPMVGIGASAGGLEALFDLIQRIPPPSAVSYVVVQHLSPDQKSILHELLQSKTDLPVSQIVEGGEEAEMAHIYVVPPGKICEVSGNRLVLVDREKDDHLFRPIDHFFTSLARAKGRNAYCVVLSGTGSDGAKGLKEIKAAGGFALVQESAGARFPGMPDSAVATGLVDFVLPAGEISGRLAEIIHHRSEFSSDGSRARMREEILEALPELSKRLSEVTGHDFSDYKPGTLVRRIERRLSLLRIGDVSRLLDLISADKEQAQLMAQDFLIGVTQFFRDPEAFEALREKVVVPLIERSGKGIRVWVPGCSTGEEAYSLAILFTEELKKRSDSRSLQVFGTDIDSHALLHARYGTFPAGAMSDIGEERLEEHFLKEGDFYRARADLRECCVFAPHNLIQDPPFSRLDLISCRNLLIYLSPDLQKRVVPRFHFSLREGGALFLGPSEGLAGKEELFEVIDKTHRIFLRDDKADATYSSLVDLPVRPRLSTKIGDLQRNIGSRISSDISREAAAEREFIKSFAAPFAVVTAQGELRYISKQMVDFVRPSQGAPSQSIDGYLAPELRVPIRNALNEALEIGRSVQVSDIVLTSTDQARMFDLTVAPIPSDRDKFMVVLEKVRSADKAVLDSAVQTRDLADRDSLETENVSLRRQLRATLEEFETSGQELKSTNEELMSMNEELQSSNEELETSREELQSINEELETVNAELRENNRQLTRANSDFKNLFEATDVAVLFLDREFCVRNFTPQTTNLFGIRRRDIGRPIFDLSSRVQYPELREDAARVDETLQTVEREVRIDVSDETFLLRMKPYRTVDHRIDGYVLSFIDITSRKNFENALERNSQELAKQYAELENLYDTTPVGLSLVDRDLKWLRINDTLAAINGHPRKAHDDATISELLPDLAPDLTEIYKSVFESGEPVLNKELEGRTPADPEAERYFLADFYPVEVDGEVYAVGASVRETTEQVMLMRRLKESEARIRRLFDASPVLVAMTDGADHVYTYSNPPHDRITGNRDLVGKSILEAFPELEGQGIIERFDKVFETGKNLQTAEFKATFDRGDGKMSDGWFTQTIEPLFDGQGAVSGTATFAYEITEQRQQREKVEEQNEHQRLLLAELQHRVKNTLATISAIARMLVREEEDAHRFQAKLDQRLQALARTHDLLTDANWKGARLSQMIDGEMRPFDEVGNSRVVIEGPDLTFDSVQAPSLGMALHELITNAVKYGALSTSSGKVTIETSESDEHVRLRWIESGGPKVEDPGEKTGFGSVVISRVLAANLKGDIEISYPQAGVEVRIVLPSG